MNNQECESLRNLVREALSAAESCGHPLNGAQESRRAREAEAELMAAIDELAARAAQPAAVPDARALLLARAVISFLSAVDERHDTRGAPLKYSVPWGALNRLRAALDAVPQPAAPAVPQSLETAARWVEARMHAYIDEHGSRDPDTGAVEFPGNGGEYVGDLMEIAEGIRALAAAPQAPTVKESLTDPQARAAREVIRCMSAYGWTTETSQAIEGLRAALEGVQAPVDGQWLPIETAPRNGRRVLVYDGAPGGGHAVAHILSYPGRPDSWINPGCHKLQPTHWMPLPAAPDGGTTEGGEG